ncbi:MAG: DUF3267 domain-containing protein [Sphaerobacter sp.]|nr:DUF3267 domain-containing protein [Sphaerobacter sp.]
MRDDGRLEERRERPSPPVWVTIGEAPLREPPIVPGYRLVHWERLRLGRLSLLGLLSMPLWAMAFTGVAAALGGPRQYALVVTPRAIVVGLLLLFVVVPLLHEAVHGLLAWLLGARPSFGIGAGFAYTTFRAPVGRRAYAAICLAPLVVLSVAGVAVMVAWPQGAMATLVVLVGNASGAVGDLWMAWRLRTVPPDARLYDLADGFAVLAPEPGQV